MTIIKRKTFIIKHFARIAEQTDLQKKPRLRQPRRHRQIQQTAAHRAVRLQPKMRPFMQR